jgi:hypothetical protein
VINRVGFAALEVARVVAASPPPRQTTITPVNSSRVVDKWSAYNNPLAGGVAHRNHALKSLLNEHRAGEDNIGPFDVSGLQRPNVHYPLPRSRVGEHRRDREQSSGGRRSLAFKDERGGSSSMFPEFRIDEQNLRYEVSFLLSSVAGY